MTNGFRDYAYAVLKALGAVLLVCVAFVYLRSAIEIQDQIYQRCVKQSAAPQRC